MMTEAYIRRLEAQSLNVQQLPAEQQQFVQGILALNRWLFQELTIADGIIENAADTMSSKQHSKWSKLNQQDQLITYDDEATRQHQRSRALQVTLRVQGGVV